MQESLAYLAGYGIKCLLICQDLNQLKSRDIGYGPDESISSNCHIRVAFPPNRIETAEYMSKLCGLSTVVRQQTSYNGHRLTWFLGRVTHSIQEVARPLLTLDECLQMPGPKKDARGQIFQAGHI